MFSEFSFNPQTHLIESIKLFRVTRELQAGQFELKLQDSDAPGSDLMTNMQHKLVIREVNCAEPQIYTY